MNIELCFSTATTPNLLTNDGQDRRHTPSSHASWPGFCLAFRMLNHQSKRPDQMLSKGGIYIVIFVCLSKPRLKPKPSKQESQWIKYLRHHHSSSSSPPLSPSLSSSSIPHIREPLQIDFFSFRMQWVLSSSCSRPVGIDEVLRIQCGLETWMARLTARSVSWKDRQTDVFDMYDDLLYYTPIEVLMNQLKRSS